MGFGGIIAGALAGGLGGIGNAISENARSDIKTQGELTLQESKAKLDKEREIALQTLRGNQEMDRTKVSEAGANARNAATNETHVTTTRMGNEQSDKNAVLQARTSKEVALMHESGANAREKERLAAELERKSVGDRFVTTDGNVLEKGKDGKWNTVTDPTTEKPAKATSQANGEEREIIKARVQNARDDVLRYQKAADAEMQPAKKAALQAKADEASKLAKELLERLDVKSAARVPAAAPVKNSTSPTIGSSTGSEGAKYGSLWK
jgi:hypothetical protein